MYTRMVICSGCVQMARCKRRLSTLKVVDETIEVVWLIPLERVQQRTVEQIVHVPAPQVVEDMAGM